MSKKQVVLALFADEGSADAAAEALKDWDEDDKDVKLKAIAVMALDADGKLKTEKLGKHYGVVKGAIEGTLLTIFLAPIGGPLGLTILGGIIGGVHREGLGLHSEDRERLSAALANGQAALGALVKDDDATTVSAKLAELGGTPETHEVSDEVEVAAASATESAEA
jgi:uncharacterized membrane protein